MSSPSSLPNSFLYQYLIDNFRLHAILSSSFFLKDVNYIGNHQNGAIYILLIACTGMLSHYINRADQ